MFNSERRLVAGEEIVSMARDDIASSLQYGQTLRQQQASRILSCPNLDEDGGCSHCDI